MSAPDDRIAKALRDIAEQAVAPRPMAAAAWRAGRRRRLGAVTAAAAAAAAATAALVVPLAVLGSPAEPPSSPSSGSAPAPVTVVPLRTPIEFRQVASVANKPCRAGSHGLPGTGAPRCFQLTSLSMAVTLVESARVAGPAAGPYAVDIRLAPDDAVTFGDLTAQLCALPSPRNHLAIIVRGHVIADPAVFSPVTNSTAQITGFATRARAENFLQALGGG